MKVKSPDPTGHSTSRYMRSMLSVLPGHMLRPDPWDVSWVALYLLVIVCGWAVLRIGVIWPIEILISIVIGNTFASMCFLAHVMCHRGRQIGSLREIACWICWSVAWVTPPLWRRWHNSEHHAHTNVPGKDPDHLFTLDDYHSYPVLRLLFDRPPKVVNALMISWFSSFAFQGTRLTATYIFWSRKSTIETWTFSLGFIFALICWPLAAMSLGNGVLMFGYFLPFVIANLISGSYISLQHMLNPLVDQRDPLATTASVYLPKWLGWLDIYHQRVGAHTIHHLFPQIPPRHLRSAEAKLAEMFPDRFHHMPFGEAFRLVHKTPWLHEDNDTLVDPRRKRRSRTLGRGLREPGTHTGERK